MIVTVLRNRGSQGARRLAAALGAGLATVDSTRRCTGPRYVINWGVSQTPRAFVQRNLTLSNTLEGVATCQDKIATLDTLTYPDTGERVSSIEWDTLKETATNWLEEDGKIVVRHTTTGHSGAGIQIVRRGEAIPNAPLYTRYFRKQAEYRLHVFYGNVILIQQKRRMNNERRPPEGHNLIRTHANGWVFALNDLGCDARNYRGAISQLAIDACNAVGCNHAAVDVLVSHENNNNAVVCEINSAPGIQAGSTLEAYTRAFTNKIQELRS